MSDQPLRIATSFVGTLDDLVVWPAAIDAATIRQHALDAFPVNVRGIAETASSLSAPQLMRWTSFSHTADIPAGTEVLYQLSIDDGATWLRSDALGWTEATISGNTAEDLNLAIGTLPRSESLRVKALLSTTDPTLAPSIDEIVVGYDRY